MVASFSGVSFVPAFIQRSAPRFLFLARRRGEFGGVGGSQQVKPPTPPRQRLDQITPPAAPQSVKMQLTVVVLDPTHDELARAEPRFNTAGRNAAFAGFVQDTQTDDVIAESQWRRAGGNNLLSF